MKTLTRLVENYEKNPGNSLSRGVTNHLTPLGNIVRIRSEKDPEQIKKFTPAEKKIRSEWLNKNASQISTETYEKAMENFKEMFIALSK